LGAPVLVTPEGWVVAGAARTRLARQLAVAPADIGGVVALSGDLPPGSSYRVHAERRATGAYSDVEDVDELVSPGAALLRVEIAYEMRGSLVETDHGRLRIDHGACAHDPNRSPGPLRVAEPQGRPPFPRRPVVLLVACDPEPDLATLEWMRTLTNDLECSDVEARLAAHRVPTGLHLTRPCLPVEESARALSPDLVIAVDDAARANVATWLRDDHWFFVLARVPSSTSILELSRFRVGGTDRRLRGHIGGPVDASRLAEVTRRLCAGPHPLPPGFDIAPPDRPKWTQRRFRSPRKPAAACTIAALAPSDESATARFEGFADHVGALGGRVTVGVLGRAAYEDALHADLLIARPGRADDNLRELIEARAREGLATVIDLGPETLTEGILVPRGATADLIGLASMATSTSVAVRDAARSLGARAQLLPVVLPRARVLEARTLRRARTPSAIVGWHLGTGAATPYLDAVAAALRELLDRRSDLLIHVVGDRDRIAAALSIERVMEAPEGLTVRSTWAANVWTPGAADVADIADEIALAETAVLGVPAICAETPQRGAEPPRSSCAVEHPDDSQDWFEALRELLDSPETARERSRETARHADGLLDPASASAIVNRFCGWARRGRLS
jgi:hypothetical protein